jgi:hypothetical protein
MRFIESLAIWLDQFKTTEEKKLAYGIVKNKLVVLFYNRNAAFSQKRFS